MNNRIKHSAFFLLLVFILPVIYQSWHNVSHHLNELSGNHHHVCGIEDKVSGSCSEQNRALYASPEDGTRCIIKDYEFSIKDLPHLFATSEIQFTLLTKSVDYLHPGYKQFNASAKSSRAPPLKYRA